MTGTRVLPLVAAVAVWLSGSPAGLQEPQAGRAPGRGARPVVVPASRHDVSPALRDVAPKPPRAERAPHAPLPLKRAGRRQVGAKDPVLQSSPGAAAVPNTVINFEGVSNVDGVLPPDTNGDIGPNHYVQWVNTTFAVYSRTGALLYGPASGRTIWSGFGGPCETQNDGDPIVLYDHLADRWFLSQFALPNNFFGFLLAPFYQCIAVSQTPDPTGPYYRYQYEFSKLNDYPKFGVWPDGYYMAINQFSAVNLQFAGQGVAAFNRSAMLAGQPASMIYFDLAGVDPNLGGMLPSDLDGPAPPPGSPNYFVQMDDDAFGYSPDRLQLWRFHADWNVPAASTFTGPSSLPVAPFDSNLCDYARACIPQPGTTARLDALADRLMYRLQYRNFGSHQSLVVNHTVDVDGSDHAGVRWYEIRDPGGTPVIHQQGTYAPDAFHRWMGSAAMDAAGNIAIAYNVSGPTLAPSIRYAARLASDPPGVLDQGENDLITGTGAQTHAASRWGDYSMLGVDPVDGCTFWATAEYFATTSVAAWQTRIGAFRLAGCSGGGGEPPPPDPPATVTVTASTAAAAESGPTSGVFTIARDAPGTQPLSIAFALSGTAVAGSDYQSVPPYVVIPAGAVSANVTIVPIDDAAIEPVETVVLTLTGSAGYVIGSPDAATVTITSDDVSIDLLVTSVTVPASSAAGATIDVTDVTKNQGPDAAPASTTTLFLSPNYILDAGDVPLGTRAVGPLAAGASSTATTAVALPQDLAPGTYVIFAKADGPGQLRETSETNNARPATTKVGPDLVVSALTAPARAGSGVAFAVTDTTTNAGVGTAGPSTTRFYLSSNYALDAADTPLQGRAVASLSGGAISAATTTLTIPQGTPVGAYYLIASADDAKSVAEHTETNNTRAALIQVGGDLVVNALSLSSSRVGSGSSVVVSDTTMNAGAEAVAASTTAFYLSSNYALDASDVRLGQARAIPPLGPGASSSGAATVTIPDLTPGTWYLVASADDGKVVAETSETNNTRAAIVIVGPDLTMYTVSAPLSAAAGSSITVTDAVRNIGGATAPPSATRVYLSLNFSLDASDILLSGSRDVPALAPGATSSGSCSVTLPAGISGTYYLIVVADGPGAVAEASETNNTMARSIAIGG